MNDFFKQDDSLGDYMRMHC